MQISVFIQGSFVGNSQLTKYVMALIMDKAI